MRRNILTRWLTDLRSNTFTQAQGELCARGPDGSITGYCCLGVVAMQHPNWDVARHGDYANLCNHTPYQDRPLGEGRETFASWAGLAPASQLDDLDRVQELLIELNDGTAPEDADVNDKLKELGITDHFQTDTPWTFDQIANVIDGMVSKGWITVEEADEILNGVEEATV